MPHWHPTHERLQQCRRFVPAPKGRVSASERSVVGTGKPPDLFPWSTMSEIYKGRVVELVYKHRSTLSLFILGALSVVTLTVLPVSPWHTTSATDEPKTQTHTSQVTETKPAVANKAAAPAPKEPKKVAPVTVKLSPVKKRNMQILAAQAMQALGMPVRRDASYAGLSKLQAHTVVAIRKHFGANLFRKAVRVAWCESRLNPTATNRNTNGTTDHGVFQINDGGTMQGLGINRSQAMQLDSNVSAAKKLYDDRGWQPWVCSGS